VCHFVESKRKADVFMYYKKEIQYEEPTKKKRSDNIGSKDREQTSCCHLVESNRKADVYSFVVGALQLRRVRSTGVR